MLAQQFLHFFNIVFFPESFLLFLLLFLFIFELFFIFIFVIVQVVNTFTIPVLKPHNTVYILSEMLQKYLQIEVTKKTCDEVLLLLAPHCRNAFISMQRKYEDWALN